MNPDIIWVVIGSLVILAGLIGCVIPALPGPPLSYIGLLLLQLREEPPFTWQFLLTWLLITIAVTVLDYVVPAIGTRRYGGSRRGVWGAVIGLILGLVLFPPLGVIIGPVAGALVGELTTGKDTRQAMRAAKGSFIGFVVGTTIKLVASSFMTYYFFVNV